MHNKNQIVRCLIFVIAGVCIMCACAVPEEAKHCLWKVTSDDHTAYLLGSLHFAPSKIYPLPDVITEAYEASSMVAFETDLEELQSPTTQLKFMRLGMYIGEGSLQESIPPGVWKQLEEKAESIGMSAVQLDKLKPWFCAVTLASMKLMQLGFDPQNGVDYHFYTTAINDGKTTKALEAVDEQLSLFTNLSSRIELDFLKQTLADMDQVTMLVDVFVRAWNEGDVESLEFVTLDLYKEYPDVYDIFIARRNTKWIKKIEEYLEAEEVCLVIGGVAHFIGEAGVVALLEKEGYHVEQL